MTSHFSVEMFEFLRIYVRNFNKTLFIRKIFMAFFILFVWILINLWYHLHFFGFDVHLCLKLSLRKAQPFPLKIHRKKLFSSQIQHPLQPYIKSYSHTFSKNLCHIRSQIGKQAYNISAKTFISVQTLRFDFLLTNK